MTRPLHSIKAYKFVLFISKLSAILLFETSSK